MTDIRIGYATALQARERSWAVSVKQRGHSDSMIGFVAEVSDDGVTILPEVPRRHFVEWSEIERFESTNTDESGGDELRNLLPEGARDLVGWLRRQAIRYRKKEAETCAAQDRDRHVGKQKKKAANAATRSDYNGLWKAYDSAADKLQRIIRLDRGSPESDRRDPFAVTEETVAAALKAWRRTTRTGHEIGAIYENHYWGGAYAVLGETESGEVEVEQVVKGRSGQHYVVGDRWTHRTSLDHLSRKIGYVLDAVTEKSSSGD